MGGDGVIELRLEGAPTDEQKERLEEFLAELMLVSRRYGILLQDEHETVQFLDLRGEGRLIGVGLQFDTDTGTPDGRVTDYFAADSILDGVWLVDTDDGPVEQHRVGPVFPQRHPSV